MQTRPLVPHDFPPNRLQAHKDRCGNSPPGMIQSSMAYSKRCRKTTFGFSNRISFLRKLKDSGVSPAPPYPPQYHGPSGEGQQFALGLSIAGSAGNDYILGPVSNFGRLDRVISKNAVIKRNDEIHAVCKLQSAEIRDSNDSQEALKNFGFQNILMTEKQFQKGNQSSFKKDASKEIPKDAYYKYKDTKASILPMPDSHFNCSEEYRYGRTFIDEQGLKAKEMYQLKLKNHVADKNQTNSNIFL